LVPINFDTLITESCPPPVAKAVEENHTRPSAVHLAKPHVVAKRAIYVRSRKGRLDYPIQGPKKNHPTLPQNKKMERIGN